MCDNRTYVCQVLREAPNLMQLVVAPLGSLPALEVLDLTACPRLAHVFIQSPLLHTLRLDSCCALGKACHALEHLPRTGDMLRGSAKPAAHVVPCQCAMLSEATHCALVSCRNTFVWRSARTVPLQVLFRQSPSANVLTGQDSGCAVWNAVLTPLLMSRPSSTASA